LIRFRYPSSRFQPAWGFRQMPSQNPNDERTDGADNKQPAPSLRFSEIILRFFSKGLLLWLAFFGLI
jgi:hypothetical protein